MPQPVAPVSSRWHASDLMTVSHTSVNLSESNARAERAQVSPAPPPPPPHTHTLWRRVVGEGLVHEGPRQGGDVVGKGQDGHRMPFLQEDGSEYDVTEEATEVRRTQTPVLKGIPVRRGKGPETSNSVGGDGVGSRAAVHSQQEGLVAPEDEGSPSRGRAVAPSTKPLGEPGREPRIVVGAKERVERARKDVISRGG